jgi:SAM-dependent methyltransferase
MTGARLQAELYALTHRGTPGDTAFYAKFCARTERVLELGAGYGRLLAVLARPARLLVGLDLDPELLRAAKRRLRTLPLSRRRSLQLVQADMRSFALGQRFQRILLPYNGLFCLRTKRDALACFRAVRAALAPGGAFAFDVWNAEAFHRNPTSHPRADDSEPIVTLQHAGLTWDVFERTRVRRSAQHLDVTYRYVPRGPGAPCQIPIAQRYYRPTELSELLERAGFVVQHRYGTFSSTLFTPRSPQLIVIARAA